jgi:hypothetical protein
MNTDSKSLCSKSYLIAFCPKGKAGARPNAMGLDAISKRPTKEVLIGLTCHLNINQ